MSGVVGNLRSLLQQAAGGQVALGSGAYTFADFNGYTGVDLGRSSLIGAGSGKTVVEMSKGTSTKASTIPTQQMSTNQYSLLNFTGSPVVSGFTLQGTPQGHMYNGLRVSQASNARVSDVRTVAIPGNGHVPPGETFGINDWRTNGSRYTDIEVDGGSKTGASGFATNSSSNVTVDGGYFHDLKGAGATFWQTDRITLNDVSAKNNTTGLNFERASGTIRLNHPSFSGNNQDIFFANDQGGASLTIVDPTFGKTYSGTKINIQVPKVYMGNPNRLSKADVHVIINGADRTADVVHWVGG